MKYTGIIPQCTLKVVEKHLFQLPRHKRLSHSESFPLLFKEEWTGTEYAYNGMVYILNVI